MAVLCRSVGALSPRRRHESRPPRHGKAERPFHPPAVDLEKSYTDSPDCAPIACAVSTFGSFGTCGPSPEFLQSRTRTVVTQAQFGGFSCGNYPLEENTQCPAVNCEPEEDDQFVDSGICSVTCGTGLIGQTKGKKTLAANGGIDCSASDLERVVSCTLAPCPTHAPTAAPTTDSPTASPTISPTDSPTASPTVTPTTDSPTALLHSLTRTCVNAHNHRLWWTES